MSRPAAAGRLGIREPGVSRAVQRGEELAASGNLEFIEKRILSFHARPAFHVPIPLSRYTITERRRNHGGIY
jgi:hypothetical protein